MCDWYEGSIVRTMHRLEELLRQLMDAAKLVGNDELEARCTEARGMLIRDVVFAERHPPRSLRRGRGLGR